MSLADKCLEVMDHRIVYRACDVAEMVHYDCGEVSKILNILVKGGLIDLVPGNGFKRRKLFQNKQKRLL